MNVHVPTVLKVTPRMDPVVRDRWVAALRSGRFPQGTGALTRFDGPEGTPRHCCLGVLCELALAASVPLRTRTQRWDDDDDEDDDDGPYERIYDDQANYPPPAVRDWAGLADRDPVVVYRGTPVRLSNLNDHVRLSFRDVANLIEEQL